MKRLRIYLNDYNLYMFTILIYCYIICMKGVYDYENQKNSERNGMYGNFGCM